MWYDWVCSDMLGYFVICLGMLGCAGDYWVILRYGGVCYGIVGYVVVCWEEGSTSQMEFLGRPNQQVSTVQLDVNPN